MNPMFMNSKNIEIYDPRRLILNLTEKINLNRSDKHVDLSSFSIYHT